MSGMFLERDELKALTQRVQYKAQARMLRSMGVEFRTRADGTLAVMREHVQKIFGNEPEKRANGKEFSPNWDALNA